MVAAIGLAVAAAVAAEEQQIDGKLVSVDLPLLRFKAVVVAAAAAAARCYHNGYITPQMSKCHRTRHTEEEKNQLGFLFLEMAI